MRSAQKSWTASTSPIKITHANQLSLVILSNLFPAPTNLTRPTLLMPEYAMKYEHTDENWHR